MRDWRARLEHWIRVWDRLPEEIRGWGEFRPPSGAAWPEGLATCPALSDFYARCDGGSFGLWSLSPLAELTDPAGGWLVKHCLFLDLEPGQWLEFGDHMYGHALWWDANTDEVMVCSGDDMEPHRLDETMEEFLTRLFHPFAQAEGEETRFWAAALAEAEKLR